MSSMVLPVVNQEAYSSEGDLPEVENSAMLAFPCIMLQRLLLVGKFSRKNFYWLMAVFTHGTELLLDYPEW